MVNPVISGSAQAKVLSRVGSEVAECIKGDEYVLQPLVQTAMNAKQSTVQHISYVPCKILSTPINNTLFSFQPN